MHTSLLGSSIAHFFHKDPLLFNQNSTISAKKPLPTITHKCFIPVLKVSPDQLLE
jgi:hypothetical protein